MQLLPFLIKCTETSHGTGRACLETSTSLAGHVTFLQLNTAQRVVFFGLFFVFLPVDLNCPLQRYENYGNLPRIYNTPMRNGFPRPSQMCAHPHNQAARAELVQRSALPILRRSPISATPPPEWPRPGSCLCCLGTLWENDVLSGTRRISVPPRPSQGGGPESTDPAVSIWGLRPL